MNDLISSECSLAELQIKCLNVWLIHAPARWSVVRRARAVSSGGVPGRSRIRSDGCGDSAQRVRGRGSGNGAEAGVAVGWHQAGRSIGAAGSEAVRWMTVPGGRPEIRSRSSRSSLTQARSPPSMTTGSAGAVMRWLRR